MNFARDATATSLAVRRAFHQRRVVIHLSGLWTTFGGDDHAAAIAGAKVHDIVSGGHTREVEYLFNQFRRRRLPDDINLAGVDNLGLR
jgi:hypothetical protein